MVKEGIRFRIRNRPYTNRNSIRLVNSGLTFFSTLEQLIREAKEEIYLQTYIFESDETGRKVANALMEARLTRGIRIHLLLDDLGSQNFSGKLENEMKAAGIEIRKFGRLFSKGWIHVRRRLHSKVIVVDGKTAMVGGINISNHYNDIHGKKAWLDFAVVVTGQVVDQLYLICKKTWTKRQFQKSGQRNGQIFLENSQVSETGQVRIRASQNDFIRRKNEVANSYYSAIRHAADSMFILGGYFLPGGKVRRLIRQAVLRGVQIHVIVSEKSDVSLVVYARRYLYAWLIRNGVNIYEYKPSNVHGKVLVADGRFVSIGSYDLNNLSTYINIELNLDVEDAKFAGEMKSQLENIMQHDCKQITPAEFKQHHAWTNRILEWLSYRFVKTLFVLIIWFVSRSKKDV